MKFKDAWPAGVAFADLLGGQYVSYQFGLGHEIGCLVSLAPIIIIAGMIGLSNLRVGKSI